LKTKSEICSEENRVKSDDFEREIRGILVEFSWNLWDSHGIRLRMWRMSKQQQFNQAKKTQRNLIKLPLKLPAKLKPNQVVLYHQIRIKDLKKSPTR
jgi:hypothetical protein